MRNRTNVVELRHRGLVNLAAPCPKDCPPGCPAGRTDYSRRDVAPIVNYTVEMAYRIEYSPEAEQHLRALTARQRAMVLGAVDEQLTHQPTEETRQRRPMRPNPLAPWEPG